MNGEKPKTSPATKADGVQVTHRRTNQNMEMAESAGPKVDATFMVATGPKSQVTGASGIPMPRMLVLDGRLIPDAWDMAVE